MIPADMFGFLLNEFNVGTSTAEKDPLLPAAQIRTQEFYDMYDQDRIDIVRGIKGAGKTALYRVFELLQQHSVEEKRLFCVFGVEATGDPVFSHFRDEFEKFGAVEFENFWLLYCLVLLRKAITTDRALASQFNTRDLAVLEKLWQRLEVPHEVEDRGLFGLVDLVSKRLKSVKAGLGVKPDPTGLPSVEPNLSAEFSEPLDYSKKPIYVGDVRDALCNMFAEKKIRIWIMLDRLDEVFPRRTKVENNGLKGLLRAAYNLSKPELRIKIFLRDDIIGQLGMDEDGFAALTHVTDRASPTMRWGKDNLLLLIVKRVFANGNLASYFVVDQAKLDADLNYREECFYKVFPAQIATSTTLDWILSSCADGNDIVTPRDVIDLLNHSKAIEYKKFMVNKCEHEVLISQDSLKAAIEALSREKKEKFLMAEFPGLRTHIQKLEGGYSIHDAESLQTIYGEGWQKIVDDLRAIGLIKHDPKKAQYKIPKVWLKGLGITQGKQSRKKVKK